MNFLTIQLTQYQKDMFTEMGNIGVGNAATALSTMINKKVNISLPSIDMVTKDKMIDDNGGDILLVDCKLEGDLIGNLVVIYNKETAFPLIDLLMGQTTGTLQEINEMGKSVFKEMVNVIAGPYLDSLADMADMRVLPNPPTFSFGKLFAIHDQVMAELPQNVQDIIFVKTEMAVESEVIFGNIYLVLESGSLQRLMNIFAGAAGASSPPQPIPSAESPSQPVSPVGVPPAESLPQPIPPVESPPQSVSPVGVPPAQPQSGTQPLGGK